MLQKGVMVDFLKTGVSMGNQLAATFSESIRSSQYALYTIMEVSIVLPLLFDAIIF